MKGDAQVISWLQAQLKNELTAINQYFLHLPHVQALGLRQAGQEGI